MLSARPTLARIALVRLTSTLTLVSTIILTGCASSIVKDTDAPGTYHADPDWGTSTLVLARDHTFSQTVTVKNGPTQSLNGRWQIMVNHGSPDPYTTINLSPYLGVTHDEKGSYKAAGAFSIYHVAFGGINIAADPNYGIAHRK